MKTPVLMYHEITDRPIEDVPIEERPYAITVATFDQHLEFLNQQNIACELILSGRASGKDSIVITFDDGHASDILAALPKLQAYDFKAEFFITTGWIGQPGYVSSSDIRRLAAAGMSVGTHGVTHKYFDDMSESELILELRDSKTTLEDIIGQSVFGGSAPGGRIHPRTKQVATELGYRYFCTSQADLADFSPATDFQFIPRIVVSRDMSLQKYSGISTGSKRIVFLQSARAKILTYAKRVLGNQYYDKIRRQLLSIRKDD